MKLMCKLLEHRPGDEVWNEGLFFATCTRCRLDIIRQRDGAWTPVPPGLRVAWHPAGHQGLHWTKALGRARDRRPRPAPDRILVDRSGLGRGP